MGNSQEDFKGKIGRLYRDSTPWWPEPVRGPAGAPNIVVIILDDVGYSDLGCYGSEIDTPRIDALAAGGIRFNNFHVTAMCSPTRACLLTGRNAHAVGVGAISEWSTGFPGYQGRITKRAATIAEILADNAYGTYAIGKWHLTNLTNYHSAGPHDHWPLGRGFSRWYGFLGGYTDHWHPDLHVDNHPINLEPEPGYHLTTDLIDHAIDQIRDHLTSAQGRPFFQYVALGAGHWPHQAPDAWIRQHRGRFDAGWDVIRAARLERQKLMGLVPQQTSLSPRNPGVTAWDELSDAAKIVNARFEESYAGFLSHADTEIGRLIDYLASVGKLDDTAIIVLSDNGASGEGGATGAVNVRKHMTIEKETTEQALVQLDRIGGEFSFSHYPMGWAQASNTPLKWYKKNTHGGGVRAPLIVHWPNGLKGRGGIATQYHHVTDIVPTFLDILGVEAPDNYRGVPQMPIQGVSMRYALENSDAPTRKKTQYYELAGDRAIWHEGWKAVAHHVKGVEFSDDRWELYNLDKDFSEIHDRADAEPDRLHRMVELWWSEAEKYGVLPLDDREMERTYDLFKRTSPTRYEYQPGMARVDRMLVPAITNKSFVISADMEAGDTPAEGAILICGNRFGGFAFYCADGVVFFEYIYTEATSYLLRAPFATGRREVSVIFEKTGDKSGDLSLAIAGTRMATVHLPKMWGTYAMTAGLTCGFAGLPISTGFRPPFVFNGTLHKVHIALGSDGEERTADAVSAVLQQD